uniref:Coiled-coil domain-containing protein 39 n=1 Tax=Takifugu rubripes TaxID=31033 RepID=H2U433_TAKRU
MINIFNAVLSELRWDERTLLPQLNEQNTDLAEKITNVLHLLELENDKEKNVAAFGQNLTEMFNNLKMELEDMDALIKAGEADMSFQNHCRAISERETGNMMQEKARIKKDHSTLLQKKYVKEAAVFKVLQQLDEYSQQEEHHKKQLEALVELSEERDLMAIHKYAERKLKIFNKEWYETLTAEMAVDKANELILQLFQETKQLTTQWEKFIKQVNEWSAQNQEYQRQLFQYKLTIQEEKSKITELTLLEKSHKSKEKNLLISLRKAADHILHLEQNVNECIAKELTQKTENSSLYKMLSSTQLVLESLRSKIRRIEGECLTYTMKVEEVRAENHNLAEQLNAVTQKTLSKDEKVVYLEWLRTDQECTIKKLEGRIEELMGKLNSQTKFLEAKTKEETTSILQIARNKVTIAEMETMRIKIEDQIMMQESNAYKIRGEKTLVQQRLAMMQGRKDDSQKFDFLKTIAELSSAVEETKKLASFHKKETSAAEDENSFLNRQNERLMKQKGQWSEKVAELDLITDTNEKALKSLLKKKCDMVAHVKVLKTEEKNMMELLLNKTDENFSFERTKLELEKAIKVREDEIREFMNLMKKQVKLSEQERQRFAMEMNQKLDMLNKMKMQFEVKFFLVAEEDKSQAYYIIKSLS